MKYDRKIGDRFYFGTQHTVWRIIALDQTAERALVISEQSVGSYPYHDRWEPVTWEQCSLRKRLNGEYLETAFSDAERDAILTTEISDHDHNSGVQDKVFLLSANEAVWLFSEDLDRCCGCSWWLRTPGYFPQFTALVYFTGMVYQPGYYAYGTCGTRPAFWLSLNAAAAKSAMSADAARISSVTPASQDQLPEMAEYVHWHDERRYLFPDVLSPVYPGDATVTLPPALFTSVKLAGRDASAPATAVRSVVAAYCMQYSRCLKSGVPIQIEAETNALVRLLDENTLCKLADTIFPSIETIAFKCRFGSETGLEKLTVLAEQCIRDGNPDFARTVQQALTLSPLPLAEDLANRLICK